MTCLGPRAVKILVFGAGVIGTVYAGKLIEAGHEVTLLARGSDSLTLRALGCQRPTASPTANGGRPR